MWSDYATDNQDFVLKPDPLSLMFGTVNFGKIWSECGQTEIHYTELIRVGFHRVFFYSKNMTKKRKICVSNSVLNIR
jgi:hypothetical protein